MEGLTAFQWCGATPDKRRWVGCILLSSSAAGLSCPTGEHQRHAQKRKPNTQARIPPFRRRAYLSSFVPVPSTL